MPWLSEAMKDVISCDKLRGGSKYDIDPQISEWGNPTMLKDSMPVKCANPEN